MKTILKRGLAGVVATGCLAFAGCQESVAYINIPADRADIAGNDPDASRVASLEAAALRAMAAELRVQAPATFLLPPNSSHATYRKVAAKAGAPFVLPEAAPAGAPVFEVRSVRARGGTATVDIVSKGEIRPLVLTEVNLDYHTDFDGIGWRASTIEPRRILPAPATHEAPKPPVVPQVKGDPMLNQWLQDNQDSAAKAPAQADGTAEAAEDAPAAK